MNLKLYRLHSKLPLSKESKKMDDQIIEDINATLFKEDLYLSENNDDDDFSIIFVESGGAEEAFLEIEESVSDPCILLTHYKNNSLPACMEIKSYLNNKHKLAFVLEVGDEMNNQYQMISEVYKVYRAKKDITGARLGIVGKPSDWLIYSKVDPKKVEDKFGISLINISMEEFQEEIDKKQYGRIRHLADIKKKWKDPEVLEEALNIYGALKRLIIRYNLEGLTVRCFDLLSLYKNTSCLAFALLNEEGYIATCEGDVPSMITMLILNKLTGYSSFQANPSYINYDKHQILFAHCTVPFDMTNSYELDTHFESGLGIGIRGELPKGEVTIAKLGADLKEYVLVSGKIVDNPKLKGYCRTQVMVELSNRDMMDFFSASVGNHMIISYMTNPSLVGIFLEMCQKESE